jgi:hypothetical protein
MTSWRATRTFAGCSTTTPILSSAAPRRDDDRVRKRDATSCTIDAPDTSYARDLRVSLERGDVTQSSFAFRVAQGGVHMGRGPRDRPPPPHPHEGIGAV